MTELQARILYSIVQAARRRSWRIPTSEELAKLFKNGVGEMTGRAANNHVQRLNNLCCCFVKNGRNWYVNPQILCTEPESAQYLLSLNDMSLEDQETVRVSKDVLHEFLLAKYGFTAQAIENIFMHAQEAGYVGEIDAKPGYLRPTARTETQLLYLELLVGEPSKG